MWKPGQLVTIKGKVYRIRHDPKDFAVCHRCAFMSDELCALPICDKIEDKYMMRSYFTSIP